jgi:hypothetical protein
MKKFAVLLIPLLFLIAEAQPIKEFSIEPKEVEMNSNLEINYRVELLQEFNLSYKIGLAGEDFRASLRKGKLVGEKFAGSFEWNVTNTPAGIYNVYLALNYSSDSRRGSDYKEEEIEILPKAGLSVENEVLVVMYKENETTSLEIINSGNVPLYISIFPVTPREEVIYAPHIIRELKVNESCTLFISFAKPEESFDFQLNFTGIYLDQRVEKVVTFHAIVPRVNISLLGIEIYPEADETTISLQIESESNIKNNLTITFEFISFIARKIHETYLLIQPVESKKFNFTLPYGKAYKLRSIEIKFRNEEGKEELIRKEFEVGFSFYPLFDSLKFLFQKAYLIFSRPRENSLWIALFIGFILIILFTWIKRRRRRSFPSSSFQ